MDANREDGTTQFKGLWTGAPWVPATPAKPDQRQQLPIAPNCQLNHPGRSNWLEAGLLTRVSQVTQENEVKPARLPGEYVNIHSINGDLIWQDSDPLQSIDTWQASKVNDSNIYGANFVTGNKVSIDDSEPWDNMSFGSLLSMAHAASKRPPLVQNKVTLADFMSSSTTFAPGFHPGIGSSQHTTSFGNSSGPELDSSLGPTYESAIHSRPFFFDLNAPPRITANATLSEGVPFQFEPITPEKSKQVEYGQESNMQSLSTNDEPGVSFQFEPITPEKTKQVEYGQESNMQSLSTNDEPLVRDANENMPSGAAKVRHEKKQKAAVGQNNATPLTQGQENNKPDKGRTEEPDSIKTPQQRPRRRKHRPKVIIEGQTKTTPKQRGRPAPVSHETTVQKKYARRKGANSPAEKNETGTNMDASTSKHTPAERRKHARTKGISELEATMEKRSTDSADLNNTRVTRRSCRRSLNFNSVSDCSLESQAGNFKAKVMESNFIDVNVSQYLTHSTDHALEGYLSGAEKDSPSLFHNRKKDSQPDYSLTAQKYTRGKCQIVFSDVTHDKEANTIEVTVDPHNQQAPRNYSICSSTNFSEERDTKILKRQHTSTSAEAEVCSSNAIGMFYNFEGRHLSLFSQNTSTSGMHFPNIYKKKRTQKVLGATNSSLLPAMTAFENQVKLGKQTLSHSLSWLYTPSANQRSIVAPKATCLLMNNHSANNTRTAHRNVRDLLGHTMRVTKKRSKGYTRVRNVASLQEFCKQLKCYPSREETISKNDHRIEIVRRPPTCLEALVADTCSTMMTKKRSKRGTRLALTWKITYSVNDIVDQLDRLDLNAQSSQASEILAQNRKLLAYHMPYQEQSALVPYQRGGALIPFDGSFDQFGKKRPRPKVDLDEETTRVWKLLLEDINSEGIDGTDNDKTKWWEEERRVFKGRADSFIARMHLVQGM